MQATIATPLPFISLPPSPAPVALPRGRLLRIEGDRPAMLEIRCCSGLLWITREGEAADIFLGAGERFTCSRGGLVLVEALESAQLVCR